jgi:hypothetical protein
MARAALPLPSQAAMIVSNCAPRVQSGGTMTVGRPDVNSIASIMVRAAMGRSDDPLSKFYREIGISALAAALDRESHEKHGRGECGVVGFK